MGEEQIPVFGSSIQNDSPNKPIETSYSPVNRNDIFAADCIDYRKKAHSVLNEGDGLPSESKFPHSHEKPRLDKKSSSQYDNQEPGFGGFNITEIEDLKNQKKRRKSQMPMDDEITNTDTSYDVFGDKNRNKAEEVLPSFGSLVNEASKADATRRKSHYVPKTSNFGEPQKNVFNDDEEFKNIAPENPLISSEKEKFGSQFNEAPEFGSFGKFYLILFLPKSNIPFCIFVRYSLIIFTRIRIIIISLLIL